MGKQGAAMKDKMKAWAYKLAMLVLVSIAAIGLAYSFPADLALLFAMDIAIYVEAVVTMFVTAQVARIRPMLMGTRLWLASLGSRLRGRTRIRRAIKPKTPPVANDDDPAPRWALAA